MRSWSSDLSTRATSWPSRFWCAATVPWCCACVDDCSAIGTTPKTPFRPRFSFCCERLDPSANRGPWPGWLYKVACRVALRAQQRSARRPASLNVEPPSASEETSKEAAWRDLRPVLDHELSRLPEKYRTVTVLCYLEGKSHEHVAEEIGCKTGAVAMRLKRARFAAPTASAARPGPVYRLAHHALGSDRRGRGPGRPGGRYRSSCPALWRVRRWPARPSYPKEFRPWWRES